MGLIFLSGMPGVGKSTVGAELARQLGWTFLDLDTEIERRAGKSIPTIFADHGEPFFRELETAMLSELLHESGAVIALGAGALERADNVENVSQNGVLVYLSADLDLLVERNQGADGRPLLAGIKGETELRNRLAELLARREAAYEQASVIINVTREQSPEEIASLILAKLRRSERV